MYGMDFIQYMANALLMGDSNIVSVHRRVYEEVNRGVPANQLARILGVDPSAPGDQNQSRRARARNPETLAEFLPFFAIRPLYNQTIWLLSKTGVGLLRSVVLISVASYFAMGVLLFLWVLRFAGAKLGALIAFLLMATPPMTQLGRDLTPDASGSLIAFLALYLVFEKRTLAPGFTLLLLSIFFRTDFVVLAGLVLLACYLERRIELRTAAAISALAVICVLMINYFAGDYGIKMLYYRNFVGVPFNPAEMAVEFSARDYVSAVRSGLSLISESFFIPFLLLGVFGLVVERMRVLFAVALSYVVFHFIVLPNWQERWVGIFYLCCGVCGAAVLEKSRLPLPEHGSQLGSATGKPTGVP